MKLWNKQGKVFGKFHIVDMIFIVLVVVLFISIISKLSGGNVKVLSSKSEKTKIELTVETYGYRESYLESLHMGDKIAEDKRYLNGEITTIDIVDNEVALPDMNGEVVVGAHPFLKKARIIAEVEVDKKGPVIKMGKQELVVGKNLFFTTERANLSTRIMSIKVIRD